MRLNGKVALTSRDTKELKKHATDTEEGARDYEGEYLVFIVCYFMLVCTVKSHVEYHMSVMMRSARTTQACAQT